MAAPLLRRIYDLLPGRQYALEALKRVWIPPQAVRQRLSFRGEVRLSAGNVPIRLHNDSYFVEQELFWCGLPGSWEAESLRLWMKLAAQASVLVDVGANTGVYSLVAAALNPSATVVAIEPVDRIYRVLQENVRRNGFNVVCVKGAASDVEGEATLYDLAHDHHYIATLSERNRPDRHGPEYVGRRTSVKTFRLEDRLPALGLGPPDAMKIDVEGHEAEVLRGLGRFLDRRPALLVEIVEESVAAGVRDLTEGMGYVVYSVDEEQGARRIDQVEAQPTGNILMCSPAQAVSLGLPLS